MGQEWKLYKGATRGMCCYLWVEFDIQESDCGG